MELATKQASKFLKTDFLMTSKIKILSHTSSVKTGSTGKNRFVSLQINFQFNLFISFPFKIFGGKKRKKKGIDAMGEIWGELLDFLVPGLSHIEALSQHKTWKEICDYFNG